MYHGLTFCTNSRTRKILLLLDIKIWPTNLELAVYAIWSLFCYYYALFSILEYWSLIWPTKSTVLFLNFLRVKGITTAFFCQKSLKKDWCHHKPSLPYIIKYKDTRYLHDTRHCWIININIIFYNVDSRLIPFCDGYNCIS